MASKQFGFPNLSLTLQTVCTNAGRIEIEVFHGSILRQRFSVQDLRTSVRALDAAASFPVLASCFILLHVASPCASLHVHKLDLLAHIAPQQAARSAVYMREPSVTFSSPHKLKASIFLCRQHQFPWVKGAAFAAAMQRPHNELSP